MIVSEGFFLNPKSDTVISKIDTGLIHINKKYKKPVLITISNYVNVNNVTGYSDVKDINRIVKSKRLRAIFINSIAKQLTKYKFQGVDLDFLDVTNRNAPDYFAFEEELYKILHAQGFPGYTKCNP